VDPGTAFAGARGPRPTGLLRSAGSPVEPGTRRPPAGVASEGRCRAWTVGSDGGSGSAGGFPLPPGRRYRNAVDATTSGVRAAGPDHGFSATARASEARATSIFAPVTIVKRGDDRRVTQALHTVGGHGVAHSVSAASAIASWTPLAWPLNALPVGPKQ
jgi:hypothetical protein